MIKNTRKSRPKNRGDEYQHALINRAVQNTLDSGFAR